MNQLVQVSTVCRNESVDTNWFIFRHARRLRIPEWTFANVALLTQMGNNSPRFARWNNLQRFWENRTTRWINFVKMIHLAKPDSDVEIVQTGTDAEDESCWVMLTHVDEWWFMMIYDVARRSMFCQLRVLGRMPLRLINVWQSFGKDCQSCADCTTC